MPKLIPEAWMPLPKTVTAIKRVILHWSAGAYGASAEDLEHYHIVINGVGRPQRGDHSILDNVSCADEDYAAHTKGLNTGSIGVAICAMAGANEAPFAPGPYPIKPVQWNAALIACADLCRRYRIEPDRDGLLMHCEVQEFVGVRQRGKWDIGLRGTMWEPPARYAKMTPGEEMRARVKILLEEE